MSISKYLNFLSIKYANNFLQSINWQQRRKVKTIKNVSPIIKTSSEEKIKYLYLIMKKQTANIITAIKSNKRSNIIEKNEYFKGILNIFLKKTHLINSPTFPGVAVKE